MTDAPLLRRIEELAAAAEQTDWSAQPVLPAAVAGLRAEMGAVRADFVAMRAELGAVRADFDAVSGRVTGALSADRAETATLSLRVDDLVGRLDLLGDRVDELRVELPGLARQLREGVADLPERTGAALGDLLRALTETIDARLEASGADLRRSLAAGVEGLGTDGEETRNALIDTRGLLESRLAALEDGLDGVSEQVEAFARTGSRETADRLTSIEDHLGGRLDQIDGFTRSALESLAAGVAESRSALHAATGAVRDELIGELTGVRGRLESVMSTQESADREVASLRVDLADALEEVRDRLVEHVEARMTRMREALTANRDSFQQTATDLRSSLLDRFEEVGATTSSRLSKLAGEVRAGAGSAEQVEARLGEVRVELARQASAVQQLAGDWPGRRDEAIATARESAEAVIGQLRQQFGQELDGAMRRLTEQLAAAADGVAAAHQGMAADGERLGRAGDQLLAYLQHRDQLLEQNRGAVLPEEPAEGPVEAPLDVAVGEPGQSGQPAERSVDAERGSADTDWPDSPDEPAVLLLPARARRDVPAPQSASALRRPPPPATAGPPLAGLRGGQGLPPARTSTGPTSAAAGAPAETDTAGDADAVADVDDLAPEGVEQSPEEQTLPPARRRPAGGRGSRVSLPPARRVGRRGDRPPSAGE